MKILPSHLSRSSTRPPSPVPHLWSIRCRCNVAYFALNKEPRAKQQSQYRQIFIAKGNGPLNRIHRIMVEIPGISFYFDLGRQMAHKYLLNRFHCIVLWLFPPLFFLFLYLSFHQISIYGCCCCCFWCRLFIYALMAIRHHQNIQNTTTENRFQLKFVFVFFTFASPYTPPLQSHENSFFCLSAADSTAFTLT